ncbi:MAG TPA: phosphotransferase [Streptosporangiaceae bacterium]
MSFVISPLVGRDGRVVHHVRGLPVVVFPYLESARAASTDSTDDGLASQLITLLEAVHRAGVSARVPVEDFTMPFDGALVAGLHRATGTEDPQGPYSEKLAKLVIRNWDYISQLRAAAAGMAEACAADRGELVLTHGDPSPANVVPEKPVPSILDWGGLKWAPAERDWAAMRRNFGRSPRCAPHRLRFYELRWALSEVTEYVTRFTRSHHGDPDDQAMWQRLGNYLPER